MPLRKALQDTAASGLTRGLSQGDKLGEGPTNRNSSMRYY